MHDIIIHSDGSIYSAGYFSGCGEMTDELSNIVAVGQYDAIVMKHNRQGNILWARVFGSAGCDTVYGMVLDGEGNCFVVGFYEGTTDFDPTRNSNIIIAPAGVRQPFISRINSDGSYAWTKTFGGNGYIEGRYIQLDSKDNIYIAGNLSGYADMDPSESGVANYSANGYGIFVTKLQSDNSYNGTVVFENGNCNCLHKFEIDNSGNLLLTGYINGQIDLDPGLGKEIFQSKSGNNAYILVLTTNNKFQILLSVAGKAS